MSVIIFRSKPKRGMDYLPVAPTICAIINGLIALFLGFYRDNISSIAKHCLMASAIGIGWIAIVSTVTAQGNFLAQRQHEQQRITTIRDTIALLITDGTTVRDRQGNPTDTSAIHDADLWTKRAEAYLKENLGASYVVRFNNDSGLQWFSMDVNWRSIDWRITRLEQFSQELPH